MSMLFYNELKLQPYLTQQGISTKDKQMLYKFRTKMIKVNYNYGLKILCPLCHTNDDKQEHLFECEKLGNKSESFKYEHIFSSSGLCIIKAAAECKRSFRLREKLLANKQPCAQDSDI